MSEEMTDIGAIGIIKGIAGSWPRQGELFVFTDRLVLVRISLRETWAAYLAMEFGLIGMLIYRLGARSRAAADQQRRRQLPEQLLATDPKGVQFMVRDIIDAHLWSGLLEAKLKLSMVNGTTREFSWVKSANKYDHVLGLLRAVLGTRLIDGKKAA